MVTLCTLSVDYINSALQIRKAAAIIDWRLFVSEFLHMSMTVLALFCSYYYNMALTTTNTELTVNAILLLFINDLDEPLMNALQALTPGWVEARVEEVMERRGFISSALSKSTNQQRASTASSKDPANRRRASLTSAVVLFAKKRRSFVDSGLSAVERPEADHGEIQRAFGRDS